MKTGQFLFARWPKTMSFLFPSRVVPIKKTTRVGAFYDLRDLPSENDFSEARFISIFINFLTILTLLVWRLLLRVGIFHGTKPSR